MLPWRVLHLAVYQAPIEAIVLSAPAYPGDLEVDLIGGGGSEELG